MRDTIADCMGLIFGIKDRSVGPAWGRSGTLLIGFIAVIFLLGVLVLVASLIQSRFFPSDLALQVEVSSDNLPSAENPYQVEIRNGVGVPGLAEQMRVYLRTKHYDVVGVYNHSSFDMEETVVIDRRGNLKIARNIAATLGLSEDRIRQELRSEYHLDASIIIGKDYGLIPPFSRDTLTLVP